jgi:hypothetical protein
VNITDSVFNLQYAEGGIYNDAVQTTGVYQGNKFTTSQNNSTIYVATSHPSSHIVIGENFNANPTIVPDGNGFTHVRMLSPFGLDFAPVTSVSGNSVDVSSINAVILYSGPYTINNFTGGHTGQLVYVTAATTGGHVLTNAAGNVGQILFPDGQNRVLNVGESLLFYFDGDSWRPIEGTVTTQPKFAATITTTATQSDSVAVPGLSSTAHCLFSARNATAAGLRGTYLTTAPGGVTLNHFPLPEAVFDVFCSSN